MVVMGPPRRNKRYGNICYEREGEVRAMSRTADRAGQEAALSGAVWDVLARQGLERLTVRAVAAAAGCTTGLVMHRVPHRRALLRHGREVLHETSRRRVEAL